MARDRKIVENQGVPEYATITDLPLASDFKGLALVQDTGALSLSNGVEYFQVLVVNSLGEIVADIIPRTDTLTNLLTVVGGAGELASAIDVDAIVQFNGATAPGKVYYPEQNLGSANGAFTSLNTALSTSTYPNIIDFLSFSSFSLNSNERNVPLIGYSSSAGVAMCSIDMVNFFKVDAPAAACKYATDGTYLVGVPIAASTTAYYANTPYATWAAYTTLLDDAAQTWKPPTMCGATYAITLASDTDKSALITTNADVVSRKALPSSGAWATPISCQAQYHTDKVFAVTGISGTTTAAVLIGSTSVSWAAITLPSSLSTFLGYTTKDTVLLTDLSKIMVATFDLKAGTISAFEEVALSGSGLPSFAISGIQSNPYGFSISVGAYIYTSPNGKHWTKCNTPLTAAVSSVVAGLSSGFIIQWTNSSTAKKYGFMDKTGHVSFIPMSISATFVPSKPLFDHYIFRALAKVFSLSPLPIAPIKLETVTASTTKNMAENSRCLYINIGSTTAAMTVNLPPNPCNGQNVMITTTNEITTLTVGTQAAPASQTIKGAATAVFTLAAFGTLRFTYSSSNVWFVG